MFRREEIKQSPHFQIIMIFVENPKTFRDKLLIHEFNKLADLRSITTTTTNKLTKILCTTILPRKNKLYDMTQFIMIKMLKHRNETNEDMQNIYTEG